MKLPTRRLEEILKAIPQCAVLADVGCDHGYVGAAALESGKAKFVRFSDISAASLDKARKLAEKLALSNCDFVCCDGLGSFSCDCAVIAGMGGLEILSVLEKATTLPNFLVLQPMRNHDTLRRYLIQRYELIADYTFFDGKYYQLISAKRGSDNLTELQLAFGKTNIDSPGKDFIEFLLKEKEKYKKYYDASGNDGLHLRLKLLTEAIDKVTGR